MAEIVLYEEVSPLHKRYRQPPRIDWEEFDRETSPFQRLVKNQVSTMIQLFSLVLEPWENRKLYLRRQLNMDDLLRKLKWHAFLLRPVIEHDRQPEEVKNLPARLKDFEGRVDKLLAERDIKMDIDLNSGRMPVIPIMDLVMGVCFDSRPWTTAEDFCQQLRDLPLSRWAKSYDGLSRSLHVRTIRVSSGRFVILGSSAEAFPFNTQRFWKPLFTWCREKREERFTDIGRESYKSRFENYQQALVAQGFNLAAAKRSDFVPDTKVTDMFRKVIQRSQETSLTLPSADDIGFALDVTHMTPKDACARCLALRFGGVRLLHQVHLPSPASIS